MLARWLSRGIMLSCCLLSASFTSMAQEKGQVGIFGGGSWFGNNPEFRSSYPTANTLTKYNFVSGGVFGFRVREMLTEHFGLEQSVTIFGNNNAKFPPENVAG